MSARRTNREINAGILRAIGTADFSRELADEGVTTVSLDAHGRLAEHDPTTTSERPR